MVGREPGEEALGVGYQRLPHAFVPDEVGEAHRVGLGDRLEAGFAPPERPIASEGSRAVAREVVREQPHAAPPVLSRRELPGHRAVWGRLAGLPRLRPRNPDALQPGYGPLDRAQQGPGVQIGEALKRTEIPARLLRESGSHLPPLGA